MKTINVSLVGVGGQGILLTAEKTAYLLEQRELSLQMASLGIRPAKMRGFLGSFTTSRKGCGQSYQVRWREFPTGNVGIESYLEFTEQGFREDVDCRIDITVDH